MPEAAPAMPQAAPPPRGARRRVPWGLAVSVAVHAALYIAARGQGIPRAVSEEEDVAIQASILEPPEEVQVEPALVPDPFERLEPEDRPFDLEDASIPEKASREADTPAFDSEATPSWIGVGARVASDSSLLRAALPDFERSDFGKYVSGLRQRGVEVTFCIDSTSSMWEAIDEVKGKLGRIITLIGALVPSYRLAIVTYRDKDDEYVVKGENLSTGRYRLLNFMNDISAAGGGDLPEAVASALEHCVSKLQWSPAARKVIVLVGDAPPHERETSRALAAARAFRNRGGVVSCVITMKSAVEKDLGEMDRKAVDAFRRIARDGGGTFSFLDQEEALVRSLLAFTFGDEWRGDVERLYRELPAGDGQKDRALRRRAATRDVEWLLRRFRDRDVHPGVVSAVIDMDDKSLVPALLDVMLDKSQGSENRHAALYAIKRLTRRRIDLDPDDPKLWTEDGARRVRSSLKLR